MCGSTLVTLIGAVVSFGPIPRLGNSRSRNGRYHLLHCGRALERYMVKGRSGLVLKRGRLEARLFRDILRVGLISALAAIQPNLTVIVITGAVGLFGIEALAGYGMASRLD